ncbi:histidine phosphatase family protein [Actinomadura montaniterrae]|uniref:Histidine phosphatase family protein n=1 Tax=Actinomadura montaniterrae TaxID=1803903 RepID=A0A6L3W752_9ACTN|nr:histidine phosphatase family protein [Actinomadura montaniterrae]
MSAGAPSRRDRARTPAGKPRIYTSTAVRARQTAEAIIQVQGAPVTMLAGLVEAGIGGLEG